MTSSTIAPIAAASDALDMLAASTVGQTRSGATQDATPLAFERVLAAEADTAGPDGAPASRDRSSDAGARGPQPTGEPEAPGATDAQPDHGRDDEHAVGRTRSHSGGEATEPHAADAAAGSDDAPGAQAVDAAPAADAQAAGAPAVEAARVDGTREAAHADGTGAPAAGTESVGAGKGHRRIVLTNEAAAIPDQNVVAAAAVTPALTGAQLGAKPGAKADAADGLESRKASDATPAILAARAIPAGKEAEGIARPAAPASPASPRVPAHSADASGELTPAPMGTADHRAATPAVGSVATAVAPSIGSSAASAGTVTPDPVVADVPVSPAASNAARAVPVSPAASTAATAVPVSQAASNVATAVPVRDAAGAPATPATTGTDAVLPTRRDARGRGAAAAAKSAGAAGRGDSSSVGDDPDLPTTAADVARARSSIARIVAAGADDSADPRHHTSDAHSGAQGVVPASTAVAAGPAAVEATPAADAALAALAAAGQGTAVGSSVPTATVATAAPAAAPAADRLAFEAIDRIRTTVTAGVPGLESRIDDPDLGTIRVVVSARLGETIRAEIVARDPAAARELASGIDRALAAGAVLPGNVDLRVRSEAAASAARPDAHLGQGGGEHARPQDQSSAGGGLGGREDRGAGGAPGRNADRVPTQISSLAPAHGRSRGPEPVAVAASSIPGAPRPGTALDVRA